MQIFRDTALRKMSSAEDLDHYVKVTNPSAWVMIGAVATLLAAALIWGFTATLPLTTSTTGVILNGEIVCFLPLNEDAKATGDSKVTAAGYETRIVSVDDDPYSQREVAAIVGSDYTLDSLNLGKWSYKLNVALPGELDSQEDGSDIPVSVTMREIAPISYLFGGAQS